MTNNRETVKWINAQRLDIDGVEVTATPAEINAIHSQGAVAADFAKLHALTASANEINVLDGAANGAATFVIGAEAANVINVGIQLRDPTPADIAMRQSVFAYLSE